VTQPGKGATLAIETSNPSASTRAAGSVALGLTDPDSPRGFRLLGARRLRPTARHDDALMPAIDALCRRCATQPRDIARIVVSVGPGGFTGLRIAVSTARLIAEAVDAETIAAPSALIAALKRRRPGAVVVLLASKRDTSWATCFEFRRSGPALRPVDPAPPGRIVDLDALRRLHEQTGFGAVIADHHTPAPMLQWAAREGIPVAPPWFSAARCLEAATLLPPVDRLELAPLYPREPEAVTKWRERG